MLLSPHRLVGAILLLVGTSGCALPRNTAIVDWARTASIAASLPAEAEAPATRAMQQALATYLLALGVLADQAVLAFDEAGFRALAEPMPPLGADAVNRLALFLRAASDEVPERWASRESSRPEPSYEDRRLAAVLWRSDAAVQSLVAALAEALACADVVPATAPLMPTDLALQIEWEAWRLARISDRSIARAAQGDLVRRIGEGHALLASRASAITQRETERQLRSAEDRLRQSMARLPPVAALP